MSSTPLPQPDATQTPSAPANAQTQPDPNQQQPGTTPATVNTQGSNDSQMVSNAQGPTNSSQQQTDGLQTQTSNVNATLPQQPTKPIPALQPTQPDQSHPSVQRAGLLHSIATALAGGPRYQSTVDPNTGTITRTQVPLSKSDLSMAIISEVLSGGMAGLSVKPGPGNLGRAAGAGFQETQAQQQQIQQNQQNQDQQSLKNQTAALAAKGAAFEQNSRAVLNTAQAERLGVESLKDAVTQNAPLLQSYIDAGQVQDTHVSQDALLAGMNSGKYSSTAQIAIPDGFTNINGKQEQTFAMVKNPSAKVPLTQEQWDQYAAAGVQGFSKGTKLPAAGTMVPGTLIARANHQMQANTLMTQDVSQVADALKNSKDKGTQALTADIPDFGKLLSDPQTGPTLQNALGKFQKYVSHSDMHGMDLYESLKQMAQPSKPNPQNPKQVIPNGDAPLANTIAGAFGNGDPTKGWGILKAYSNEIAPTPIKSVADAESILSDHTSSPQAMTDAKNFLATDQKRVDSEARVKAQAQAAAKAAGIDTSDAKDIAAGIIAGTLPPTVKGLYRNAAGVEAELGRKGYNLATAQLDYTTTQRRLATLNGTQQVRLQQAVNTAYSGVDLLQQKYDAWKQAVGGISGFQTLNSAALKASENLPGAAGAAAHALQAQIADQTSELAVVYQGGNSPTDHSMELAAKNISGNWNEEAFTSAITNMRQNIGIRRNSINSSAQPIGVSSNSPYLHSGTPTTSGGGTSSAPNQPPAGATVKVPGSDGKMHWSDGKRDLGVVQ